jgi:Holliday junction resolvase RusA-like endonuclease
MYKTTRGMPGVYKSQEAKQYPMHLLGIFKPKPDFTGSLEIWFYFKTTSSDIDGRLKCLLDSLQGLVYENDKEITDLIIHKRKDANNPRVELSI